MRSLLLPGAIVAAAITACSSTSAQQAKRLAPTDVVAIVGSTSITLGEVDDKALQQPVTNFGNVKLSVALYQARRAALDELVAVKLMDDAAKAQGIDRSGSRAEEITLEDRPGHRRRRRVSGIRRTRHGCRALPWTRYGNQFVSS